MSTLTPLMSLTLPTIGTNSGLFWEQSFNADMGILDGHDHSVGSGSPVSPSGLNINQDLPFNGNNATGLRSSRYNSQLSVLTGPLDLGCVYVVGGDLYYNNGAGTAVQVTTGSTVNATSSGISNGTNTASFPGSPANTLVVKANSTTPANIEGASILIGNTGVSGSHFITLSPPNTGSLSSDYPLQLPPIPLQTNVMTLGTDGSMNSITYDQVGQNMTSVGANAIAITMGSTGANTIGTAMTSTGANAVANTRTRATAVSVAPLGGVIFSGDSGSFTTSSTSPVPVTDLTGQITSASRPIFVGLQPLSGGAGLINLNNSINNPAGANFFIYRNGSPIYEYQARGYGGGSSNVLVLPPSSFWVLDNVPGGTYTYTFYVEAIFGFGTSITFNQVIMTIYEI